MSCHMLLLMANISHKCLVTVLFGTRNSFQLIAAVISVQNPQLMQTSMANVQSSQQQQQQQPMMTSGPQHSVGQGNGGNQQRITQTPPTQPPTQAQPGQQPLVHPHPSATPTSPGYPYHVGLAAPPQQFFTLQGTPVLPQYMSAGTLQQVKINYLIPPLNMLTGSFFFSCTSSIPRWDQPECIRAIWLRVILPCSLITLSTNSNNNSPNNSSNKVSSPMHCSLFRTNE